ncbi:MAG TPA: glutathione peroxidase [Bacteroidia bacterium]|nr:glutathione peroxidase [Bacteroidia bacterium]HNU33006.1 glutathione peroxidase [Bacteroidia bacterium]
MGIFKTIINYFYVPRMKLNKHLKMGIVLTNTENVKPLKSVYEIEYEQKSGVKTTLSQYKGKKILIVNTASECGYTPQYAQLQEMHMQMNDKLQILAFPSNDFGAQEPGSDDEIANFCKANYGVTFPVLKKITIIGENKDPLYEWLSKKKLNGWNEQLPQWNFCKYLIDEEGNLAAFFSQHIEPESEDILTKVLPA